MSTETKTCKKCLLTLPVSSYYKGRGTCRECYLSQKRVTLPPGKIPTGLEIQYKDQEGKCCLCQEATSEALLFPLTLSGRVWLACGKCKGISWALSKNNNLHKYLRLSLESSTTYHEVYKITDPSGKVYIGQKRNDTPLESKKQVFYNRLIVGREDALPKLFYDICLIESLIPKSLINARESFWISHYKATNPNFGYNTSWGNGSAEHPGYTPTKRERVIKETTRSKRSNPIEDLLAEDEDGINPFRV